MSKIRFITRPRRPIDSLDSKSVGGVKLPGGGGPEPPIQPPPVNYCSYSTFDDIPFYLRLNSDGSRTMYERDYATSVVGCKNVLGLHGLDGNLIRYMPSSGYTDYEVEFIFRYHFHNSILRAGIICYVSDDFDALSNTGYIGVVYHRTENLNNIYFGTVRLLSNGTFDFESGSPPHYGDDFSEDLKGSTDGSSVSDTDDKSCTMKMNIKVTQSGISGFLENLETGSKANWELDKEDHILWSLTSQMTTEEAEALIESKGGFGPFSFSTSSTGRFMLIQQDFK